MRHNVKIDIEIKNETAIFYFQNSIEENICDILTEKIDIQLKNNIQKFIFDFSQLDFIASSGFGSIIVARKRITHSNGTIVVSGLHGVIEKLFKISALDKIFSIYSDAEEALKKIG